MVFGNPYRDRRWPGRAYGVGALTCAALFVMVAAMVVGHVGTVDRLDAAVSGAVHTSVLAHLTALPAVTAVTDLGSPLAMDVAAVVAAVALWRSGWPRGAGALLVSRAAELGIEIVAKHGIGRPRPSWAVPVAHAGGFSFPSGHAGGTAVLVVFLLCVTGPGMSGLRRRVVGAGGAGLIVAIAVSRVALGVHYPSDVLAGALLGAGCALAGAVAAGSPRSSAGPVSSC